MLSNEFNRNSTLLSNVHAKLFLPTQISVKLLIQVK